MKRVLLVDDDAVVIRAYRDRLSAHGFQVNTAPDGVAAIKILRSGRPDVVVLDLMMPTLSGVDVLRFMRADTRLAKTPVVVLTNAYLNDLGREAAAIGVQQVLLKSQCSPSMLMSEIDAILAAEESAPEEVASPGKPAGGPNPAAGELTSAPPPLAGAARPAQPPAAPAAAKSHTPGTKSPVTDTPGTETTGEGNTQLIEYSQAIALDLRNIFQAFAHAPAGSQQQNSRLQDLYRKVHFLTATANLTRYGQITQLATVFEALLYVLIENGMRIGPSVLRTLAQLVDLLELLFQQARCSHLAISSSSQVLLVDDDVLCNRLAASALRQAQLNVRTTEDPLLAWQWLQQEHFDLVLLDIEMPKLNGLELCKRLRTLPSYAQTPVVYVTVHSDFQTRAQSTLSGADDLIAKPILPIELAAKVVMHLLKHELFPDGTAFFRAKAT